jgi:hypothetical protein
VCGWGFCLKRLSTTARQLHASHNQMQPYPEADHHCCCCCCCCHAQGALGLAPEAEGSPATAYEGAVFSSDDPEYKDAGAAKQQQTSAATGAHSLVDLYTSQACHCCRDTALVIIAVESAGCCSCVIFECVKFCCSGSSCQQQNHHCCALSPLDPQLCRCCTCMLLNLFHCCVYPTVCAPCRVAHACADPGRAQGLLPGWRPRRL